MTYCTSTIKSGKWTNLGEEEKSRDGLVAPLKAHRINPAATQQRVVIRNLLPTDTLLRCRRSAANSTPKEGFDDASRPASNAQIRCHAPTYRGSMTRHGLALHCGPEPPQPGSCSRIRRQRGDAQKAPLARCSSCSRCSRLDPRCGWPRAEQNRSSCGPARSQASIWD